MKKVKVKLNNSKRNGTTSVCYNEKTGEYEPYFISENEMKENEKLRKKQDYINLILLTITSLIILSSSIAFAWYTNFLPVQITVIGIIFITFLILLKNFCIEVDGGKFVIMAIMLLFCIGIFLGDIGYLIYLLNQKI